MQSGTAAQVGEHTITVATLQDEARSFAEDTGQPDLQGDQMAQAQAAVLGQLITNQLMVEAADEHGVSASPANVDKSLSQLRSQMNQASEQDVRGFLQQYAVNRGMLEDFIRTAVLGDKLVAELRERDPKAEPQQVVGRELSRTSKRLGVEVNPRYGTWNGQQVSPTGGELVKVEQPTNEPSVPQLPSQ